MTTDSPAAAQRIRIIALVLLILMPVSALGSRFGLWPYPAGLLMFGLSMLGSLLIQIINAIWLLRKPPAATKTALRWASLLALPPLIIVASIMRDGDSRAGIHNISTDIDNPPVFSAAIKQRGTDSNPLEYNSQVAAIQRKFFPDIRPIITDKSPQQAFEIALSTAKKLGWEIYAANPDLGRIEAVDTTFWFGFKDDIVIRIAATEKASRVDLRSVSRVGQGDMGANADRINQFTRLFNQP